MNLNISAFTHVGTTRKTNQDNILVNGQVLNEGETHLIEQDHCICFVADGVGGNKAGEFASNFVLDRLRSESDFSSPDIEKALQRINESLLAESREDVNIKGTATTLTGIIIKNDVFKIIHAGDSQMWLLRNDMFFQVTNDQVLDEMQNNSPITSYFGGNSNYLHFDDEILIYESQPDDIFMVCSDGLFKSLNQKIVKSILTADKNLETKAKKILENSLQTGAEDNISVILIHQII